MLVIARKVGQTVLVGDEIEITVSSIRGDQVRLAINAPRRISIFRKEAVEQVALGNAAAVGAAAGLSDVGFSILDFGLPAGPNARPSSDLDFVGPIQNPKSKRPEGTRNPGETPPEPPSSNGETR